MSVSGVSSHTQADIYYQLAFCVEEVGEDGGESTVTVDTFDTCDQDSLDEDLQGSPHKREAISPDSIAEESNEYVTPRDDDAADVGDDKPDDTENPPVAEEKDNDVVEKPTSTPAVDDEEIVHPAANDDTETAKPGEEAASSER